MRGHITRAKQLLAMSGPMRSSEDVLLSGQRGRSQDRPLG